MTSAPPIAPGTVFGGDYQVERPIAAGGMGAVYVARQISTQKLRALKIMLPQLVGDAGLRSRFKREAIVGSHIESDHVVEVLAAGIDEAAGIPWLAMELLAGEDVSKAVEHRGVLPRAEVIELLKQFGHALTAAHNTGVIHRDLKPENLFLATARRDGVPFTLKVLDFGIAKIVNAVQSHATTGLVGSPIWMAPEQTDVAAGVSLATDIWTLGLIAFWLLTGRHYWLSGSASDATLGTVMRELLVDPLPPASVRAQALGVAHLIPPGFDAWFSRCLVRDANARYQHASQAFPPLIALLSSAPMPVVATSSTEPLAFAQTALPYPATAVGSTTNSPMVYGIARESTPDASRNAPPRRRLFAVLAMVIASIAAIGLGIGMGVMRRSRGAQHVANDTAAGGMTTVSPTNAPPVEATAPVVAAEMPSLRPQPAPESAHHHAASRHGETAPHESPMPAVPAVQAPSTPTITEPTPPSDPAPPPPINPPAAASECMIEAGPLWNNDHAQRTCPGVCSRAGGDRFTGAWTTTRPGEMSVCRCAFPAGARCP